jgi:hypothetical protein
MADLTPGNGGGTPRWVKVSGVIAMVLVLLFVFHIFFGGMPETHALPAGSQTPS